MPIPNALRQTFQSNDTIVYALSQYLNTTPRALDEDFVRGFARDCGLSVDEAFLTLLSAACGLDTAENRWHRQLEQDYLRPGLHQLDPEVYRKDAYYQTVRLPAVRSGDWQLCYSDYAPFEPFVCNHPILTETLREIPQIGYFHQRFAFPAVLEKGVEWMTVTPNEIETMRVPIQKSHGQVVTLGLGLGYFAFHAAQKQEVTDVTVIERDSHVIELFRRYILPQIPHGEKIRILQADAFVWLEQDFTSAECDFLFADLWHDASDGLDMYLRLRRILQKFPTLSVEYWIEPSLLSALRHMVYSKLIAPDAPANLINADPYSLLSDSFLKRLAPDLRSVERKE